jgi:hypothetical protein
MGIKHSADPSTSFDVNSPYVRSEIDGYKNYNPKDESEPMSFRPVGVPGPTFSPSPVDQKHSYFNRYLDDNKQPGKIHHIERMSYNKDLDGELKAFQSKSANNIMAGKPDNSPKPLGMS